MKSFVLGAVAGAAVVWFWGREISDFIDEQTLGVREATADRLQAAADGLQVAKETIETGLGGA